MFAPGQAMQQALVAFQKGELAQAESLAKESLKSVLQNADAYHLLAMIYKKQNKYELSARNFEKSLQIKPTQPAVLSNFANLLVNLNQFNQAEKLYNKAIQLQQHFNDAIFGLGQLYLKRQKYQQLILELKPLIQETKPETRLLNLIGSAYRQLGHNEEALRWYETSCILNPHDIYSLYNKASLLRENGKASLAIALYEQLQESMRQVPEYHFGYACALYDDTQFAQSEAYLNTAIQLRPDYVEAHEALNKLLWENDNKSKFLQSYQIVKSSGVQTPSLLHSHGLHLLRANRLDESDLLFSEAVALFPQNAHLKHALSVVKHRLGQHEWSIKLLKKALELDPACVGFRLDMANHLIRQQDYSQALVELDIAGQLEPDHQEVWAYKGICWRFTDEKKALWLNNYDQLVFAEKLTAPTGFDSIEHFMHELKQVLRQTHMTKCQPLDQSVIGGTQSVGQLFHQEHHLIQSFKHILSAQISSYMAKLPADLSHPLLRRNTGNFRFTGSWSVALQQSGYHSNHVHPQGWLSACTYVELPQQISPFDSEREGWLKLGETSLDLGKKELIAKAICPEPGLCVLFPGYIWHGTYALKQPGLRVTAPCDIAPY
jgi:Tfp pilus assembly protein PilF